VNPSIICIFLQVANGIFAFVTSEVQTKRIMKTGKRYNGVIILLFVAGGLLAGGGTFLLNKEMNSKTKELMTMIINSKG
jgi:hypothetical protein